MSTLAAASSSVEVFEFSMQVDRRNLANSVRAILHTIFFHRVFGTIRPKTLDLFGMTFPAVDEPSIEDMVQEYTTTLCKRIESSESRQCDLVVYLLHPSTGRPPLSPTQPPTTSKTSSTDQVSTSASENTTTAATTGGSNNGSSTTSSNPAKALKSWATSKTMSGYPYTWLAQAFSGGTGQAGSGGSNVAFLGDETDKPHSATAAMKKEHARLEKHAFEISKIRFELHHPNSERERIQLASNVAHSLCSFLDKFLVFIDEKKSHIPAIISADLCPFPIEVQMVNVPLK